MNGSPRGRAPRAEMFSFQRHRASTTVTRQGDPGQEKATRGSSNSSRRQLGERSTGVSRFEAPLGTRRTHHRAVLSVFLQVSKSIQQAKTPFPCMVKQAIDIVLHPTKQFPRCTLSERVLHQAYLLFPFLRRSHEDAECLSRVPG